MKAKRLFRLDEAAIDEICEAITEFCKQVGAQRKDMLRYRLSAEECLLYWMDHGLRGSAVSLQTGRFMLTPYATLEIEGPSLNPYADDEEDYGEFTESVLTTLGLSPEYSYTKGHNCIRFRIKKKSLGQIGTLCIVLGVAAVIGILGVLFIPESARNTILTVAVNPLYNTFFKVLGCIAGPMIFLSVAWGVYGIGDAATFGKIGRKMMLRYVLITFAASAACALYYPFLGPSLSEGQGGEGQFATIAEMLFGIFPSNIVEPFETGNTLQIIFIAIVIGIALLYLGRQTTAIAKAIDQINVLVQFLMQFVSKLVPYVIFLVVISMIWSGDLSVLATAWKFLIALLSSMVLISIVFVVATSVRMKTNPVLLVRKSIPTFLISLTTASSAAAFGTTVETCEKRFGIDDSLVSFGVPLGMVIQKPIVAAYFLLLVFFFASQYGISCSIGWICVAVFVSAVVAIAAPPIPGGMAVAYSVLFLQLGIPMEAMAIALAIDIVIDFFITAFHMFVLQLSLVSISSKMGMIDEDALRRDERASSGAAS